MSEKYAPPPRIIHRTLRAKQEDIELWSKAAADKGELKFSVLDLQDPAERARAAGGFDALRDINKMPGEAIVERAEQEDQRVVEISGTAKEIGAFWHDVLAHDKE